MSKHLLGLIAIVVISTVSSKSFACTSGECTTNTQLAQYILEHTRLNGVNDPRLIGHLVDRPALSKNQIEAIVTIYYRTGSYNIKFQEPVAHMILDLPYMTNQQLRLVRVIAENSQYTNGIDELSVLPLLLRKDVATGTADIIKSIIEKSFVEGAQYTDHILALLANSPDLAPQTPQN